MSERELRVISREELERDVYLNTTVRTLIASADFDEFVERMRRERDERAAREAADRAALEAEVQRQLLKNSEQQRLRDEQLRKRRAAGLD
jgi:hypothetical protein